MFLPVRASIVAFALLVPAGGFARVTLPFVRVWPPPTVLAPTTTHVWIEGQRTFFAESEIVLARTHLADARDGSVSAPQRVPTSARSTATNGDILTLEVRPLAELLPSTRYDVWRLDPRGVAPPRLLSTFITGDGPDHTPPKWNGAVRSFLRDPKEPTGNVSIDPPSVPSVEFVFDSAFDRACAPAIDPTCQFGDGSVPVMFGAWMADANGVFAYDAPPVAYMRQLPNVVRARREGQNPTTIGWLGNELYDLTNFEFPRGPMTVRLGVRAVDLSGNASAATEVVIKLPK